MKDTNAIFTEVSACLAGSCAYSADPLEALTDALYNLNVRGIEDCVPIHHLDELYAEAEAEADKLSADNQSFESELNAYLEEIEQFYCDNCGWWGHPGENLDEHNMCSDCSEECEE